jgi:hypothetical protein
MALRFDEAWGHFHASDFIRAHMSADRSSRPTSHAMSVGGRVSGFTAVWSMSPDTRRLSVRAALQMAR